MWTNINSSHRVPKKVEVEEPDLGDEDEMLLEDSDSEELVIMHDDEEESQVASAKVDNSASSIKEEKQEHIEEVKVVYQCIEVRSDVTKS